MNYHDDSFTTHQPRVIYDQVRGSQSLFWDANGNLAQIVDCKTGAASINFWDEENRLRLAVNPKYAGYYGYDANGERVYKLTGRTQYDDLNGSNPSFGIIFDGLTVYPSPYIVLTEKQYTKHYYIGSEKIATMIGDGGILLKTNHLSNEQRSLIKDGFCRTFEPTAFQYDKTPNIDIQGMHTYQLEYECGCIEQVDLYLKSIYPMLEPMMKMWQNSNGCKNEIYYTHSNHLGSASWITDADGKPIQYIHYAPYGELIANQQTIGYDERFKFTGKERDWETGYDYFGARFYDHRKGIWNSVDPLADKNPNETPYLYCGGNPIMLVDPDGRLSINMIAKDETRPGFATYEDGQKWIKSHDRDNKSTTLFLLFHFKKNATQQEIEDKITSLNIIPNVYNWQYLLEAGELLSTDDKRQHIVIQACYGAQIAEEIAKQNPGVYVSGASGELCSRKTQMGYKNVSNHEKRRVTRFFIFKREETVDAKWYTYYCDPITKELKKWEYTQAEPPQLPKEYEQ